MAVTPQPGNLATVLAQLEQGWQELAELLRGQHRQIRTQVIEAEKFVLVDPRGEPRGRLEGQEDGSAALVLLDRDGKYRAWLGLKEDGSAYLTLKDRLGRISWETPREPLLRTGEAPSGPGGDPADSGPESPALLARLEQLGTDLSGLKDLLLHNRGAGEDREEGRKPAAPAAGPAEVDPGESQEVNRRLKRLERRLGRVKTWGALAAALVLVAVAGLGFTLNRGPQPGGGLTAPALTIHDPQGGACRAWLGLRDGGLCLDLLDRDGKIRSTWGLDKDGDPSLQFYDRDHKLRAELALSAQGDPGLSLVDQAGRLRVALGGVSSGYQVPPDILERPLSSLVLFNQDGAPVWRAPLRWHR